MVNLHLIFDILHLQYSPGYFQKYPLDFYFLNYFVLFESMKQEDQVLWLNAFSILALSRKRTEEYFKQFQYLELMIMKSHISVHLSGFHFHMHCCLATRFPQMNHYLLILNGFCLCCSTYPTIMLCRRGENFDSLIFDWSYSKILIVVANKMARESMIHQAI